MNWYAKVIKISTRFQMSYAEALRVFGFEPNIIPSKDEIRAKYRKLAIQYHPDKQGGDASKFIDINNANEVLSTASPSSTSSFGSETKGKRHEETRPQWQTDNSSFRNQVNTDLHDLNWAKYTIYNYSTERGEVERWNLYTHDGGFFRDGATFMTNIASLEYAAKVVEHWSNQHREVKAVVANREGTSRWLVVRINGVNHLDKHLSFICEEGMPWNDKKCNAYMQYVTKGIDYTA